MLKVRSYPSGVQLDRFTAAEAAEVRLRTSQVLLAIGMLIAGTANTLVAKATFSTVSEGEEFDHPFVMAGAMFLGELMCLGWYELEMLFKRRRRGQAKEPHRPSVPKHIFALPAFCDIAGTGIMYVGLTLTSASTYQMLRGSVIIFTGVLSATYLKRRQWGFHWCAMCLTFAGVVTVGLAASLSGPSAASGSNPTLGNALVVLSQCFTALQMCLEERFCQGYSLPALLAVGWEGLWGLVGLSALLLAMQQLPLGAGGAPIEDSVFALEQVQARPGIILLMLSNALSIAFFNFFGMSITKTSSAAYRMVLDSLRTLAVWGLDLAYGGGKFHPLQLLGFALMLSGTAIYNEAVRLPCFAYQSAAERAEAVDAASSQRGREQALLSEILADEAGANGAAPKSNGAAYNTSPVLTVEKFFSPKLSRYTMNHN